MMTSNFRFKTTTEACRASVRHYDGYCVITGVHKSDRTIVGGHIFQASVYPQLKLYKECIVPIQWSLHTGKDNTLDWIKYNQIQRSASDRIKLLINNVQYDFRDKLQEQIHDLCLIMNSIGMHKELDEIGELLL